MDNNRRKFRRVKYEDSLHSGIQYARTHDPDAVGASNGQCWFRPKHVILKRQPWENRKLLIMMTQMAKSLGANIARTIAYTHATDATWVKEERAQGTELPDYGRSGSIESNKKFIEDLRLFTEVPIEHYEGFLKTILIAKSCGLNIDANPRNFRYNKNGITCYDPHPISGFDRIFPIDKRFFSTDTDTNNLDFLARYSLVTSSRSYLNSLYFWYVEQDTVKQGHEYVDIIENKLNKAMQNLGLDQSIHMQKVEEHIANSEKYVAEILKRYHEPRKKIRTRLTTLKGIKKPRSQSKQSANLSKNTTRKISPT